MSALTRVLPSSGTVRRTTFGLGIGVTVFGVVPILFPRRFCEAFGLPMTEGPAADVVVRSVGVRDLINGLGIVSSTVHRGRVSPWLLARLVADGTDTAAILIAFASGARSWRLLMLGAMALGATVADLVLYRSNKVGVTTIT